MWLKIWLFWTSAWVGHRRTVGLVNEACGRLVSRLRWWYKCYRWTLLREGTPPVLGVETEACGRLVSRLWWYKCYRGTLLREGTPPAVCLEHQNVSMSRTSEHQYVQNIRTSVCPEHQNVSMSRTSERQYVKNIRTSVLPPRGEFLPPRGECIRTAAVPLVRIGERGQTKSILPSPT